MNMLERMAGLRCFKRLTAAAVGSQPVEIHDLAGGALLDSKPNQ
jgi:hypothetical protein